MKCWLTLVTGETKKSRKFTALRHNCPIASGCIQI